MRFARRDGDHSVKSPLTTHLSCPGFAHGQRRKGYDLPHCSLSQRLHQGRGCLLLDQGERPLWGWNVNQRRLRIARLRGCEAAAQGALRRRSTHVNRRVYRAGAFPRSSARVSSRQQR
jgi:hypothetical protein